MESKLKFTSVVGKAKMTIHYKWVFHHHYYYYIDQDSVDVNGLFSG